MEFTSEERAILASEFNKWKDIAILPENRIRKTNSDILLVDGL